MKRRRRSRSRSCRRSPRTRRLNGHVIADIGIVVLSILIAVILVKSDVLTQLLDSTHELEALGAFFAGIFFTSVFTTAPSVATLGHIAVNNSLTQTVLIGAAGAVLGDLLMFRFIKDRLSESLVELVEAEGWMHRTKILLKRRSFRWSAFLLGGLLIAVPFPTDELGITLMGFAKMRMWMFIAISYTFNAIGIAFVGLAARALTG